MSYNNSIPQPGDNPSQSQSEILANFQVLDTANSVNHVAFNDVNQGKHKFMQMPEQSSAPTTAANEGALYTKEANSITSLFFRKESNGTEIQLTNNFTTTNPGSVTLQGGLIIKYGFNTGLSNNSVISFGTAFPSTALSVQVTLNRSDTTVVSMYAKNLNTSGFTVATNQSGAEIWWIAIGA